MVNVQGLVNEGHALRSLASQSRTKIMVLRHVALEMLAQLDPKSNAAQSLRAAICFSTCDYNEDWEGPELPIDEDWAQDDVWKAYEETDNG